LSEYLFAYPCTFLGGKKSTKRTAPGGLAFGCPLANGFSGAGRNSPACGGAQTACPLFPENPPALGCAAKGGGRHCGDGPGLKHQGL